jgi:hypothetical protein
MACDYTKRLQSGQIPSPRTFRAQATGVGQTVERSEHTGMMRAQRVADSCSPECAKMLPRSFPTPRPGGMGYDFLSGEEPPHGEASCKPMKVSTTKAPPADNSVDPY